MSSTNRAKIPQNQRPSVKVILVGNSGVGKTCLIASFNKQAFDFKMPPNVAPAYSFSDVRNSQGLTIRLQIWDTAGQEKYLSVNQLFFRDSGVALVCFEAGDQGSLASVPDWVKRVKDEVPSCELIFVLTKSDLRTKDELDSIVAEAQERLKEFNPKKIYVTSALTRDGVVDVFDAAADAYRPKNQAPKSSLPDQQKKKSCC